MRDEKNDVTYHVGRTFSNGVNQSESGTLSVIQLRDVVHSSATSEVVWPRLVKVVSDAKYSVKYLQKDDILVVAKGPTKKAILLTDVPEETVPTQHFLFIRIENKALYLPEFVAFYLNTKPIQTWLNNHSGGSYQSTLSKTSLAKLPLPKISIENQKKIVDCADSIEDEIRLHHLLIESRRTQLDQVALRLLEI
ncbi:MAG: restriction endonuclease subunit S [Pararheinheimera sp.]|jgi:restriction endonuclease S subunit|nr:restriction endonuclease subunit S [Rheinheimera sp.]